MTYVKKIGSYKELVGQSQFYHFLSNTLEGRLLQDYFPKCYKTEIKDDSIALHLEHVKGVPASYLWSHGLWGDQEWILFTNAITAIHNLPSIDGVVIKK